MKRKTYVNKYTRQLKDKGITLIALIITIIVLLILASIAIATLTGSNGLLGKAEETRFKNKMAEYNEKTKLYTSWQISETMSTDTSWINSGEVLKKIIEQEILIDITEDDVTIDIKDIIENITKKEEKYVVVYKGEMYYVSNKKTANNEKQVQWCTEIGIKILEFEEPTGIVVRDGSYQLVNGIYLCTPKLNEGFKTEKTRYLEVNDKEYLIPGEWISSKPTENWYDYNYNNTQGNSGKGGRWANIYVESEGTDIYYTWIPRYCFKLDQTAQRSDVKFIDIDNSCKDANDNKTTWEELEQMGYQVPEAFTFNGEELSGYWAMKYTAGDVTTPSTINYDMSVSRGVITIKNITTNATITSTNPIVKFTIALNGKIIQTIEDANKIANINKEVIEFSNLKAGDNTINVTGLNVNGEIVGSMTKQYSLAIVNKPELSGFNKDTTFYVTYDEKGIEHSTIPISEPPPKYWYEYGSSEWANIVTRNNGLETYYTWIPRYEFTLDQTNQRSTVKFITGTSTQTTPGYQIPEAFTFNGKELLGYWAMKYTAGE